MELINSLDKETALDMKTICKRTKLKATNVSPMLTELFKSGVIARTDDQPKRFFKADEMKPVKRETKSGTGETTWAKEITCPARERKIPADKCVYNDASPVCRGCDVRQNN